MTSENIPKVNIRQNLSIIEDLEKRTDLVVQSQDQPSNESISTNLPTIAPTLPSLFQPEYGGPGKAKEVAKDALVAVSRLLNPDVSEESLAIVRNYIDKSSRGSGSALPLICTGKSCPFLHVCSLDHAGLTLPVGAKCPLETTLVSLWVNKHLKSLGIEDIDNPENSFDMDLLYELATQELIRYRCSAYLSKNPSIVESKMVAESFNGTPIFADVMNPVMEAMEKAGRNIAKIRDALLATRKAQVNAGQVILDSTEKAAILRAKAKELNKLRQNKEVVHEAEFKVKDEPIQ